MLGACEGPNSVRATKTRRLVVLKRRPGLKSGLLAGAMSIGLVCPASPAMAQTGAQGLKLYVLPCGTLSNIVSLAAYDLENEPVARTMSVTCALVVHPRGTLLWDTGVGDNNPERPSRWVPGPKPLKDLLSDIGYTPDRITYLALSHGHSDHTGNANDYAGATWLVQKAEYDSMFGAKANTNPYKALKDAKTVSLTGDHDVFGDGTVMLKSTPGHSPGHQVLFVKLAKTAPVVLSGDLYHYAAERTLDRMPPREREQGQTKASRAALDEFMKKTGAQLWITHDIIEDAKLRKSPSYYE